ncbi:class I SAM-dependent methyltransferase [Marinibactrum halimedae]|uniref:Methyltransferase type 11 domain-containing protein n=1 Tax=Marinibactrum halimedae TaxID=1444977 RepID=A0AA37WK16_9GAMM|nr:class I SAM-dependent methyltransferase [Marinibactrum halimedae]MCD9461298.1 class I SAM-dependent methyltransferase [Marinibactrum halimedae]GLS24618.1 hypothetical protein GCM10007877_03320 [Marinibactrum halimedae]
MSFKIITKADLFKCLDRKRVHDNNSSLKNIQDGYAIDWLLDHLGTDGGKTVLEMGGGHSRVARRVAGWGHQVINADKFEGIGQGPKNLPQDQPYEIVQTFLGDFSSELQEDSFDIIYSISVVEHVPLSQLKNMMADAARLLKPGGKILHLIDTYIFDTLCEGQRYYSERGEAYLQPFPNLSLEDPEHIDRIDSFSAAFATNSDVEMWRWTKKTEGNSKKWKEVAQSLSIAAVWEKFV